MADQRRSELHVVFTIILCGTNFSICLVATNAVRFRIAAGDDKILLEFGLRRAQGPDGALSASKYCYMGGFDGTSNVLAGKKFGIPVRGTKAHSFVSSFLDSDENVVGKLQPNIGKAHSFVSSYLTNGEDSVGRLQPNNSNDEPRDFYPVVKEWLEKIAPLLNVFADEANTGELVAFAAFAVAFPTNFLAIVDNYNVFKSGLPNFVATALALNDFGYRSVGIRLDSGDLAYQSKVARATFKKVAEHFGLEWFAKQIIVASNDINEETLYSLKQQGHEIDSYGIGTHLVTCQRQPALGCVYKLVEINKEARMKISEEVTKVTIPGRKCVYRLFGKDGKALTDLMMKVDEKPPLTEKRVLCRHPTEESKRAYVKPAEVKCLHKLFWEDGKITEPLPSLEELRERVKETLATLREDHLRSLNPTPYKVSLSHDLYAFMHSIWLENAPIGELA